jgi:hypothetical protein
MVTTSNIPALLLPGNRKIKGMYRDMPKQWTRIYARGQSHMEAERTVHVRYMPLPQLKTEGAAVVSDNNAGQRFTYNHVHVSFGSGYSFSREAIDDNLYKSSFNPANLGLAKTFNQMREVQGAAPLNTGQVLNPSLGGDNLPLFHTSHPVDGYTVANTASTQFGLNESSQAMAANMIRRFRDNAGLFFGSQAKTLVVPVNLRQVAMRLLMTERRPGTADNDINTYNESGDMSGGYVVMDYLTNPYSWFMLSDAGGLICLDRTPFETSMQVEALTNNLIIWGYERYYMGVDDWRLGVGFFPSY